MSGLVSIFFMMSALFFGSGFVLGSETLFDGTLLGLGSCEFTEQQLCEVSVVDIDKNPSSQKLTELKFKKFRICEGPHLQRDVKGLRDLENYLERLAELSQKKSREEKSRALALDQRSQRALRKLRKSLELVSSQASDFDAKNRASRVKHFLITQELASAFFSNFQYPVEENQNIFQGLASLATNHSPSIGIAPQGRACNLQTQPSRVIFYSDGRSVPIYDPEPSSFWSKPPEVGKSPLGVGYDRALPIRYSELKYDYDSPKDGYGINPGFNVRGSDGALYKIRLGHEVHSGPFNSRIIHALGFPVLKIDYVKKFQTQFNLKLLLEFNSRKSLGFNLTFLGQVLRRFELQEIYDPFDYIESGVLKSGELLSSEQLKMRLIKPGRLPQDFRKIDSFDLDFSNQIESLTWKEVSIEKKDESLEALGAWFYDGLNHENRRELRGFAVLAAWLGIFDVRWENTRVFVVKEKPGSTGKRSEKLRHIISDLGSGLGRSGGIATNSIAEVSQISRSFFELIFGYIDATGHLHHWTGDQDIYPKPEPRFIPVFAKYSSILPNHAFRRTDFEDTLWMATYILQITPSQIREAAEASGFSSREVQILVERLVARQNNLRTELYLEGAPLK